MKLADYKKSKEFIAGVRSDGFRIGLSTLFAPGINVLFKDEMAGAWNSPGRMWVFDRARVNGEFAAAVKSNLPKNYVFEVPAVVEKIKHALANPDPDLFVPGLDVQLFPVKGGGVVIMSRYDAAVSRAVNELHGRFLRTKSAWHVRQPTQVILEKLAERAGVLRDHVYIHDTEIVLQDYASASDGDRPGVSVGGMFPESYGRRGDEEGENSILSVISQPLRKLPVDEAMLAAAAARYGLYDYQQDGVRHLIGNSSSLLADDMGLGKTRQAIVASILVPGGDPVVVISPANLKINWQREINTIDPEANVAIVGQDPDWHTAQWVIVNYERLGGIVQAIGDGLVKFRAVLYDEAHYLKEADSARTRNAFLLSAHIDRRFLLTATPILNRESEMHTLLRLSGHPIGEIPLGDFQAEFAGEPELRKGLADRLSEWMLRRRKDVLKGLKGKSHDVQYIELAQDQLDEYRSLLADGGITAIVKIGRLRRMLELMKATWLIETISSLAEDAKSIVFCEYVESVETLVEEFAKAGIKAVKFTGEDTANRKQRAVDTFMDDADTKVFIGTTGAAGVGLNLTVANYVFFATLPWTAAAKRQAEDRAYRNGQTRHVTVMIPVVVGSIDEQIVELLKHKESIEQDLLADSSVDEREQEKLMARKLLEAA